MISPDRLDTVGRNAPHSFFFCAFAYKYDQSVVICILYPDNVCLLYLSPKYLEKWVAPRARGESARKKIQKTCLIGSIEVVFSTCPLVQLRCLGRSVPSTPQETSK